jgi:hypothetical protein
MYSNKSFKVYLIRFILIAIFGLLFYSQIAQFQLVQNANDTNEINISTFDKVLIFMSFILPVCTLFLILNVFDFTKANQLLKILIICLIITIIISIPIFVNIYTLIINKNTTPNKYLQVITQIYSVFNMLLILGFIALSWVFVHMYLTQY